MYAQRVFLYLTYLALLNLELRPAQAMVMEIKLKLKFKILRRNFERNIDKSKYQPGFTRTRVWIAAAGHSSAFHY